MYYGLKFSHAKQYKTIYYKLSTCLLSEQT